MALSEKNQKIFSIALRIFTAIVVAVTVAVMVFTIVTVALFDKNDRAVFGYKFFIVQSDSMSLSDKNADLDVHFNAGDLIVVKSKFDVGSITEGDVITFVSQNEESYLETVTHMVKEVLRTSSGSLIGFKTYGTNTGAEDAQIVEPEFILGVYSSQINGVGKVIAFMKSVPGYIVCVLTPFLLLIGYQAFNVIVLYKKYKNEQNAALIEKEQKIDQERNELAAQKLEAAKMLEELAALKAQLASVGAISPEAAGNVEPETAQNVEPAAQEKTAPTEEVASADGGSVSENN
jgi:signal peptidase I